MSLNAVALKLHFLLIFRSGCSSYDSHEKVFKAKGNALELYGKTLENFESLEKRWGKISSLTSLYIISIGRMLNAQKMKGDRKEDIYNGFELYFYVNEKVTMGTLKKKIKVTTTNVLKNALRGQKFCALLYW